MAQPQANLLSKLHEAKEKGFIKDLTLSEDGDFMSSTQKVISPKVIEIIQCYHCSATLYLVAGENEHGTWVHHWDI